MPVEERFTDQHAFLRAFQLREDRRPHTIFIGIRRAVLAGVPLVAKAAPLGVTADLRVSVHAEFSALGQAALVCDAPYAVAVEVGSRPHWMPIEPLVKWVQVKLGISDQNEAYRVAGAIQKKIATEGTKPTWFMMRLLPKLKAILKEEIKLAMQEDDGGSAG